MRFHRIDMSTYARREHFEAFLNQMPCTYSATVNVDVTRLRALLKKRGLKAYPAQIYMLARAVNQFPEFRMSLDASSQLGYWETSSPRYTVLNPETKTFSGIWTSYSEDFATFYRACVEDSERYATGAFSPKPEQPENLFDVSSIPWLDFTSFNLNLTPGNYLLPIMTIGKYVESNGATLMPLAIQVHHAVCDGYHLGQFVAAVRELAASVDEWLVS
jgi:chloramphenicol O-acetyltransferase type A